jgi:hypothetical protein
VIVDQLRQSWQARAARAAAEDEPADSASVTANAYRALRRDLLTVEGAELTKLFDTGDISDPTRRRIQRTLDLEQANLHELDP